MKPAMKITDRPLSSIRPYERNPRNNKKAVEKVMKSFQDFGVRWPILVDKDGVISQQCKRVLAGRREAAERA
ncbi:MAG: ParB N-terminal domain-containing protein [Oscillospiraceae bacterium]|nr:ParB N-terminal domain-containing protein [Oscillospiraceae bacterium]